MGDNNETFLINAMRGSGLKGLTGMKAVDPPLVRPLLYFNRKEIENYALEYQVPYVKDVSNELNLYVRNIIRNEFLSRVEKLNPNIDKRINHTIEKIRSDYNLLEELIDKIKDKYISANQGMIIVDMDILEHYREGKTLLYHLLSQYGVNIHQIDDMAASGVGTSFDTLDYAINLDRGKLLLKQKVDDYHIELDIPNEGTFMIHQDLHLSVKICDSTQIHKEDNEIILSLAKVTFPLKLRTWMPGDRFYPSGMNGNSKKVSKYLKDLKIPNIEKSGIFVLISDDGNICGIPGYRSDHRYLPDNEEQKVLVIQWIKE
jgi:tRNA(Ile)-lysidine synthase